MSAKENNTVNTDTNPTNGSSVKTSLPKCLQSLLDVEKSVKEKKKEEIGEQDALIVLNNKSFIFPNTIVMIQGKSGSHKSRFAQTLAAACIKDKTLVESTLGLNCKQDVTVAYIDTERNHEYQFPKAIQSIQLSASIPKDNDPENLRYTSLLGVQRKERFDALKNYIKHVKLRRAEQHTVIILDVFTDLVVNFNDPEESLKLIDYVNLLISNENCTVICVIHENPGSNKARGHTGTELENKSSTAIAVSVQKRDDKTIIELKPRKSRSTELGDAFQVCFDPNTHGLRRLTSSEQASLDASDKKFIQDLFDKIIAFLDEEKKSKEVKEKLSEWTGNGLRKMDDYIKKFWDESLTSTLNGKEYKLQWKEVGGKKMSYSRKQINLPLDEEE